VTGIATYYYPPPNRHVPATLMCASPNLRFGTHVSILDLENHKRTRCVVGDREGRSPGRVVDLGSRVFARLAPLARGVIRVRLGW